MTNNDLALHGDAILGQVQTWLSENKAELLNFSNWRHEYTTNSVSKIFE